MSRPGSSPLTRGKPCLLLLFCVVDGLIPAHAGKTAHSSSRRASTRAHPRSRGENTMSLRRGRRSGGSSPLTRGKPSIRGRALWVPGLIPAHAGKTVRLRRCRPQRWAHPRSRGENLINTPTTATAGGSSPLTRGKHFLTCAFIAQIGQILESLELCASSESYSSPEAYATDALQGRVRSIDLGLRSSRGAS